MVFPRRYRRGTITKSIRNVRRSRRKRAECPARSGLGPFYLEDLDLRPAPLLERKQVLAELLSTLVFGLTTTLKYQAYPVGVSHHRKVFSQL